MSIRADDFVTKHFVWSPPRPAFFLSFPFHLLCRIALIPAIQHHLFVYFLFVFPALLCWVSFASSNTPRLLTLRAGRAV